MKPVLSHLVLLAVVTTACGDSFNPSSVAGVYEWVDAPVILSTSTIQNGIFELHSLWVDWQHYTLTAASNWTREASYTTVAAAGVGSYNHEHSLIVLGVIMKRLVVSGVLAAALSLTAPTSAPAQDEQNFLAVGEMAPDFEVAGATRYGILSKPVKLSDYRGETVVLAFFFRARTRG